MSLRSENVTGPNPSFLRGGGNYQLAQLGGTGIQTQAAWRPEHRTWPLYHGFAKVRNR